MHRHGSRSNDPARGREDAARVSDALARGLEVGAAQEDPAQVVTLGRIDTPLGAMVAGTTDRGICLMEFGDRRMLTTQVERLGRRLRCRFVAGEHALLDRVRAELEQYFEEGRRTFEVPLEAPGSPFQRRVWLRLRGIPYGRTMSYAELASAIGRPGAVRAVGRANGDNRLAILIPCHRVIGADAALRGYGGKVWRKRRLLELEGAEGPWRGDGRAAGDPDLGTVPS